MNILQIMNKGTHNNKLLTIKWEENENNIPHCLR